ncbi:TlpA family protein disulfide reductase [Govanella unica]|uniref:TlpA family protein disulfide reductase n=1 Tax=Govanella unica TaxID=2975056 RepID=A0A9X3TW04_9PROT|nr:TlpA disulfide reductase family protein [Govania unica]MDA5192594.1 TlpA family protein disulfide reductase [Govania unica]
MTRLVALLTATIILLAVAAALVLKVPEPEPQAPDTVTNASAPNTPNTVWLQEFAVGEMQKLAPANPAAALPMVTIEDDNGRQIALPDLKGKVLLINFWATWCAPCRHEMPALDTLQGTLGGPDFAVVPISIDRGGRSVAAKFFTETGIKSLPLYIDSSSRAARALNIYGLPVTLLVDHEGYEIARFIGPAEWASADAQRVIRATIERAHASRGA